jgi:hypothetical protein
MHLTARREHSSRVAGVRMDIGAWVGKAARPVISVARAWRRKRLPAGVHVSLDWDGYATTGPAYLWRAVRITVAAANHEEFVLAAGAFEFRTHDEADWMPLVALADVLVLPITVPPHRVFEERVSGATLASGLPARPEGSGAVQIRLLLSDPDDVRLASQPIWVTVDELTNERFI